MSAPEGNKNAIGNKGGKPTLYKNDYADQAYKLSLLGATDKEMADFFCISERTFNNWKKVHIEFLQSIKRGKLYADANVADRLYQRALGFEHASEEIKVVDNKIKRVKTKKIYPPDTMAAIYWLNNRQKQNWKQKQTTIHEFNPEQLTDEQLDKVFDYFQQFIKPS